MSREPYKVVDLSMEAGERVTLPVTAAAVTVLGADAAFEIGFDKGDTYHLEAGLEVVTEGFSEVHLQNSQPSENTLRLAFSIKGVRDARLTVSSSLSIAGASLISDVADVTLTAAVATLVAAAKTSRKSVLVTNLANNAKAVRVGSANVGASRGIEVSPGQTATLDTTAAVYAYCETAQALAVLELDA